MPSTEDRTKFENSLLTFGKVKEESKDTFVRFIGELSSINVKYNTEDKKYHEAANGDPRRYGKAIVYYNGKFVGKIALITPYLEDVLNRFGATDVGKDYNDIENGRFIVVSTKKLKSNKIAYTVRMAVSKKPISVDLMGISFPDIHSIITPENEMGMADSAPPTNNNDLFDILEPGGVSSDGNNYNGNDDDDVPF